MTPETTRALWPDPSEGQPWRSSSSSSRVRHISRFDWPFRLFLDYDCSFLFEGTVCRTLEQEGTIIIKNILVFLYLLIAPLERMAYLLLWYVSSPRVLSIFLNFISFSCIFTKNIQNKWLYEILCDDAICIVVVVVYWPLGSKQISHSLCIQSHMSWRSRT